MRWILIVVGAGVGIVALIALVGSLLPRRHVASVRVVLRQPAESVFATITDVRSALEWRTGLKNVEVLSAEDEPLRWRETYGFGTLTLQAETWSPPHRMVARIEDTGQPFGGRWIHDVQPTGSGSILTITEDGEVYNPFFRFMSRFVFGYHRTLEQYITDLGRRLDEPARAERVNLGLPRQ